MFSYHQPQYYLRSSGTVAKARWRHKRRMNLILDYGDICYLCLQSKGFDSKLEFHHLKPTNLHGMGRGFDNRIRDIMNNRDKYITLCRECHEKVHGFRGYRYDS